MPKVNFEREEVLDLKPRWELVRDCLSGAKKIKSKKDTYLPRPNAADKSAENKERYNSYLARAVFYGVTARTLKGLAGQVFARDPVTSVPKNLEVVKQDANGGGVSLDQQARKAVDRVLAYGRGGILVDYPTRAAPATKEELEKGNVRPTITLYDPWDIINWRTITVGVKVMLSLVVISEAEVTDDDGFEQEWDDYYRVLRLRDGVYWSEIWYFDKTENDFVMESAVKPLDGTGKEWTEIPFSFVGSDDNDPTPDLPPLYDLAELNIAHYRNSADYEESCYQVGQPTPYFAGLTEQWVTNVLKDKIPLGSRAAVLLPEGGTAGLLQPEPNIMPREAMQDKERQMVALGAKLVEQKAVQRTATEAGMEEASTTNVLATAAKNVSQAFTQALVWCAKFLGDVSEQGEADATDKSISYVLNSEFDLSKLEPTAVAQIVASWQANAISTPEMRDNLRRGGIAYQSDEEYEESIQSQGPDLGVPVGSPASAAQAALDAKKEADAAKLEVAGSKKVASA